MGAGVGRADASVFRTTTTVATLFTRRAAFFAAPAAFFTAAAAFLPGAAVATFRGAGRVADDPRATAFRADRFATVRRFALARADERERRALACRVAALRAARRGLTTDFARVFAVFLDFFAFAGLLARFGVTAFRPPIRLVFALAMTLLNADTPLVGEEASDSRRLVDSVSISIVYSSAYPNSGSFAYARASCVLESNTKGAGP